MTDRETLDKAKLLFVGATQGDKLAREVIAIAETNERISAVWQKAAEEMQALARAVSHDQTNQELVTLRAQRDELSAMLTPLKDAALFARAQRRPMGIGQDHSQASPCVQIQLGAEYGRERDCVGFWINSPEIGQNDADSPNPCHRIALALIRLSYAVAEKVTPRK